MPHISLTRLRLRSVRFLPGFAYHAIRSNTQVAKAQGFHQGATLMDRKWTFWTLTVWNSQDDMRAFMTTGAHKQAMPRLLHWCDEASVAHWQQDTAALPAWHEADQRMRTTGRISKVLHPSPNHASLSYDAPRTTRSAPVKPR